MRLYYVDKSEGPRFYVRSALGVDAERWNVLRHRVQAWRKELQERYGIPSDRVLRTYEPLTGQAKLAGFEDTGRTPPPSRGVDILKGGLRVIEGAAREPGGVEVINVCLRRADVKDYERISLDRLLNRVNSSVAADDRFAHLIFGEGEEGMIRQLYERLRSSNPMPSRYETWDDGAPTKDIPVERIIGGPTFRNHQDDMLQMAGLVAHALLMQEENRSRRTKQVDVHAAFGILDTALNRRASRRDHQGVVRR